MLYKGFSNTILVIDESLIARKTICRNLEYYKYKVLATLRAAAPEIKIAVVTEDTTDVDQKSLVGVIRKPVRVDRLLAVVRRVLDD